MKHRYLEMVKTAGQEIADFMFSGIALAQRQLWLASLR